MDQYIDRSKSASSQKRGTKRNHEQHLATIEHTPDGKEVLVIYSSSENEEDDVLVIDDSSDDEDDRKPAAKEVVDLERSQDTARDDESRSVDETPRAALPRSAAALSTVLPQKVPKKVTPPPESQDESVVSSTRTAASSSAAATSAVATLSAAAAASPAATLPTSAAAAAATLAPDAVARLPSASDADIAAGPDEADDVDDVFEEEEFGTLLADCRDVTLGRLEQANDAGASLMTVDQVQDLFRGFEQDLGKTLTDIEMDKAVKGSDVSKDDSTEQERALYGRALPALVMKLETIFTSLEESDVFGDVGHGLGTVCTQVALARGCEARGIEMNAARNNVACGILSHVRDVLQQRRSQGEKFRHGLVRFRHGRLEDPAHRMFLTDQVNRLFCNNFNDVFGGRATNTIKATPDYYLAGIFTQMLPGAELVTLHPIPGLPPPISEINSTRKDSGLREYEYASFYEMEEFLIEGEEDGTEYLDFLNPKESFRMYKYTKKTYQAEFLCTVKSCDSNKKGEPMRIQAWTEVTKTVMVKKKGKKNHKFDEVRIVPVSVCPHCSKTNPSLRKRGKAVTYRESSRKRK